MNTTKTWGLRTSLLMGAATVAVAGSAGVAVAQDQQQAPETVVVTGSRIPQVGLQGASAVTTLSQQQVQLQGSTSIGNLLQILPSVVNDGDGDTVDNGTGGIATIDLRNLGAKRTLVLVDGKRLVAADASLDVDTNVIPPGMIDHVEVLTGGDSAVYGSDAVAGVVNVILKKDFEGIQVDTQFGETDKGDGFKTDTSMMLGVNSANGKGNITIYGEYNHRDPISEANRSYGAHTLAATNYTGCASPATHFGGFCFSGSGTIAEGRIKSAALGGPYAGSTTMFTSSGTLVPYDGRTYNFAPYQYYQTQGQRYAFGANGHYQVTKDVDVYTRLTFADNSNTSQIASDPLVTNFDINCGNPLMSVEERQTIFGTTATSGTTAAQCATVDPSVLTSAANGNAGVTDPNKYQRLVGFALRLVQVGPRITQEDHQTFQMVLGARGDLPGVADWTYDVSAQYGQTAQEQILFNDTSKKGFQAGLLVDPTTGNCYAGGTCVPLNVFTTGGLSSAAVDYLRENLLLNSKIEQWDLQAAFTGDLGAWGGQSPWAHDPIGVSIGAEYRQEKAQTIPDQNLATGNLVGFQSTAPSIGQFSVAEGFAEVSIPIIQDKEFFRDVTLHGAYRFSAYDRAGDTQTYRGALEWSPTEDFKLRASFDRAVRAPNVAELFTPAGGSSANAGRDPCSANSNVTTTAALCEATGVPAGSVFTAALNCPTNQCQGATGGNPFLKPEEATTRSLGVVLTPTFIDGFSATVDWYDIKIAKYIQSTPLQTILNNCYSTALNPSQSASNIYCGFVHRDVLGTVATANSGYVIQAEGNIANDHVQGIDFELNYLTDLSLVGADGWGSLAFNYIATYQNVNDLSVIGFNCMGKWGAQCGEPEPRFRGNLRTTWNSPDGNVTVSLLWRHLSSVRFELNDQGFTNTPTLQFPAYDYFDLSGTWNATETLAFRAGIRNLFDKNPPLTDNNTAPASDINGNTFPNTYDALGRVWFIGATARF